MRENKIQEFAKKLYELENNYGVEVCSDNYYTRASIVDVERDRRFAYHYEKGQIELDD